MIATLVLPPLPPRCLSAIAIHQVHAIFQVTSRVHPHTNPCIQGRHHTSPPGHSPYRPHHHPRIQKLRNTQSTACLLGFFFYMLSAMTSFDTQKSGCPFERVLHCNPPPLSLSLSLSQ